MIKAKGDPVYPLSDAWFLVSTPGSVQPVNEAHVARTSVSERSLKATDIISINQSLPRLSQALGQARVCKIYIIHTKACAGSAHFSNKHLSCFDIHTVYALC